MVLSTRERVRPIRTCELSYPRSGPNRRSSSASSAESGTNPGSVQGSSGSQLNPSKLTGSRRSSRRCCWRSTATATAARTSTAAPSPIRSRTRSAARSCGSACWTNAAGSKAFSAQRAARLRSSRCRSPTRSGSSTAQAPPACRSRSCTARAASCWKL